MDIGTKIKQLRESKNWSQEELALELGISQPTIILKQIKIIKSVFH